VVGQVFGSWAVSVAAYCESGICCRLVARAALDLRSG